MDTKHLLIASVCFYEQNESEWGNDVEGLVNEFLDEMGIDWEPDTREWD